jgi:hypothetical protein
MQKPTGKSLITQRIISLGMGLPAEATVAPSAKPQKEEKDQKDGAPQSYRPVIKVKL